MATRSMSPSPAKTSPDSATVQQLPQLSQKFRSIQVLIRFVLRFIILTCFATLGAVSFANSLIALLWMSALISAGIAMLRREPPFDTVLNYWDETVIYTAMCMLVIALRQYA
jgi:hypothetical protein